MGSKQKSARRACDSTSLKFSDTGTSRLLHAFALRRTPVPLMPRGLASSTEAPAKVSRQRLMVAVAERLSCPLWGSEAARLASVLARGAGSPSHSFNLSQEVQKRPSEGLFVTGPEPNGADRFELVRDLIRL
jgi:hypothetical protein